MRQSYLYLQICKSGFHFGCTSIYILVFILINYSYDQCSNVVHVFL